MISRGRVESHVGPVLVTHASVSAMSSDSKLYSKTVQYQKRVGSTADPAGHYAKRDSTRLLINRKRQRPVVQFDDAPGWEEVDEIADAPAEAAE